MGRPASSRARRFPGVPELADVTGAALGARPRLISAERLRGGSKKGVYRLARADQSTVIAYIWSPAENFWTVRAADTGPFAEASGPDLFEASHSCLEAAGVPVPRVFCVDRSQRHFPADIAFVEDIAGSSLEVRLRQDPEAARPALARLGEAITAMHGHRSPAVGKVAEARAAVGQAARPGPDRPSCPQLVLDRARADLDWAAGRLQRLREARERIGAELSRLARLPARAEHALVHGELGPDHVLISDRGDPVLIDIEGLMYFDAEWEHAFLRLRFREHYRWLRPGPIEEERARLYSLALHLSLVAGPLRLLDGDFPDREPMLAIAEHNLRAALAFA